MTLSEAVCTEYSTLVGGPCESSNCGMSDNPAVYKGRPRESRVLLRKDSKRRLWNGK